MQFSQNRFYCLALQTESKQINYILSLWVRQLAEDSINQADSLQFINNGLQYKSNMQTNMESIESALLNWISNLASKKVSSFFQLIDCQFYLSLLSQVEEFKLIQPIEDLQKVNYHQLNLTQRINRVKVLGRSVIRFYQIKLLRDVSSMKINYVQLCMGNHFQSIKFFSMIIGILSAQQSPIYQRLASSLQNIQQNDKSIISALLQNSRNIGEPIQSKSEESPMQRKKIISKLQKYEDRIQELEEINELTNKLFEQEKNKNISLNHRLKELDEQKLRFLQKIQIFQNAQQKLESQVTSYLLKNQTLQRKKQIQKRHYEEMLSLSNVKIQKLDQENSNLIKQKKQFQQLRTINKQLKSELNERRNQKKEEQKVQNLLKLNYDNINSKYQILLSEHQTLQLKHHKLMFDMEACTLSNNGRQQLSILNGRYEQSQGSSNKYRVRDNLSLIRQNISQMSISSLTKNNQDQSQNLFRQGLYYSNPNNILQLNSALMGMSYKKTKNVYNVSQFNEQLKQKTQGGGDMQKEQKQQLFHIIQTMKAKYEQEMEVLIMINKQLFVKNQEKQKQLRTLFLQKQKNYHDKQLFKHKLKQIDQIEHQRSKKYAQISEKQNIDPNSINYTQKNSNQNEEVKKANNTLKTPSNNSESGYYQMVFN